MFKNVDFTEKRSKGSHLARTMPIFIGLWHAQWAACMTDESLRADRITSVTSSDDCQRRADVLRMVSSRSGVLRRPDVHSLGREERRQVVERDRPLMGSSRRPWASSRPLRHDEGVTVSLPLAGVGVIPRRRWPCAGLLCGGRCGVVRLERKKPASEDAG